MTKCKVAEKLVAEHDTKRARKSKTDRELARLRDRVAWLDKIADERDAAEAEVDRLRAKLRVAERDAGSVLLDATLPLREALEAARRRIGLVAELAHRDRRVADYVEADRRCMRIDGWLEELRKVERLRAERDAWEEDALHALARKAKP